MEIKLSKSLNETLLYTNVFPLDNMDLKKLSDDGKKWLITSFNPDYVISQLTVLGYL